ncbi:MAG: hypothetical protein ACRENS_00940 [Candidatus Eiseniibacteriota bacterium]
MGFIFVAVLLGYATRSIFNERAFSERVASSLGDPRVAEFAAEQITDAVIDASPDLVGVRPVLIGLTRSVVASTPFRAAVRRGARVLHHSIMTGSSTRLVLNVQDLGSILESTVAMHPALAKKIPPGLSAAVGELQSVRGGALAVRLVRIAGRMRALTVLLLVMGVALAAAAVGLSREKRRALVRLGIAFIVFGLLLAIVARFGSDLLALFARRPPLAPVLAGAGGAFLAGLMAWACGLGFAGLVLSAASASLLEQIPLAGWGTRSWLWLTGPQPRMRTRLGRGGLGAGAGAAILLWPLPAITVALWCAGAVVAFAGLREAFVAALHLLPELEAQAEKVRKSRGTRPRARAIALLVALVAVLLGMAWWIIRPETTSEAPQEQLACNGSLALCDRRLDQVVFATSHNSMGGADNAGWMFPNQDAGIGKQLEDGVRAFLIDAHYGEPVGDKVKTILDDEKAAMAKYQKALGAEGMAAVLRIRDRLAREQAGPRDVYMCHGFCELGALKLVPVLKQVRAFLVENPGEVLIFVIQDESVTPADIERCFQESGLEDFVYRGAARPPWPTLREMVESDQRVLVMAENHSEGVAWYHPAFEVLQETPYEFHEPSEFSNRPNRGGTGGSLLLMNHWIESTPMPKPSNAAIVNAHDALLARVRACERERRHIVNLVAVDFYGAGDLISTVRELNARPLAAAGMRR